MNVKMDKDNNVLMKDNSPSSKDSGFAEEKLEDNTMANDDDYSQGKMNHDKEEIDFVENPFHDSSIFQLANHGRNPLQ